MGQLKHDAFRDVADGDPLSHLWSRKLGAYFVSAVEATRIVRSVPAHAPPVGVFTLVTLEATARSEVQPVETIVVFPDNSHHICKVFLTHLGTDKLRTTAWTTVSLASVDSVEVLLEWWKDLSDGAVLAAFDKFVKLASSPVDSDKDSLANKGKSKGKGKTKHGKLPHRLSDTLVANLNSHVSHMLGDATGQKLAGAWTASGHNVRADIIRVSVRLPKADALTCLKSGTQHSAVLVRDIHTIPEAKDLCCVWISPGCPVLEGSAAHTRQSLQLYLASFAHPWSVVRTPFRWGIRIHKDHEREVKAIVQPHAVFVPADHFKYRIAHVPRSLDPAVLVATLTSDSFKPYLVSSFKGVVTIAAPCPPADIVFTIAELGCTLLLQHLPGPASGGPPLVPSRHVEDASPKRKSRRADSENASVGPDNGHGADTRGGAKGGVLSTNPFGPLDDAYQVAFPPLPNAGVARELASTEPEFELGTLPNLGNTCFAAVAVRCLAHIVKKSDLRSSVLQDVSLRRLLDDLSPAQWTRFIKHHHLEHGQQQDAALWLQKWLDSESVLCSHLSVTEHVALECVGCSEPKTAESSFSLWRVPAPSGGSTSLQKLLDDDQCCSANPEVEVSCSCCFAEHAEAVSKRLSLNDWLLIQTLRADVNDKKKHTAISLPDTVVVADASWDMHLAVCHLGESASSGHYVLLVRSGHDWLLYDDGTCRVASAQDILDMPSSWSFVLYRRRCEGSSPQSPAVVVDIAALPASCADAVPSSNPPVAHPTVGPGRDDRPDMPSADKRADSVNDSSGPLHADLRSLLAVLSQRVDALEVEVQCLRGAGSLHEKLVSLACPGSGLSVPVRSTLGDACSPGGDRLGDTVASNPGCDADKLVVASCQGQTGMQAQSFPCGPPPPVVIEPVPSDALPKRKKPVEKQSSNLSSIPVGSFPRSTNPAIVAEILRLQTAGFAEVAWIFERLHADSILLPLAQQAQDVGGWKNLGEALTYNSREAQTQLQNDGIHSPSVRWLVFRMLQRGRYNRFASVLAAGHWDLLRQSLAVCDVPDWWSPPWCRPVHRPHAAQARGRRPLLPHEWHRAQSSKRSRPPVPAAPCVGGPVRSRSRSRFRDQTLPVPVAQPAVVGARKVSVAVPTSSVKNKKKRKAKGQADVKGGETESGSTPSLFRVAAMNVTSLFSRVAAVCALTFGLACVSETALTGTGQASVTTRLQQSGRCVVWGAPVHGPGVSSSRGVALIGGPGVRLSPLDLPDCLLDYWADGRIVAGKVSQQFGKADITCVACYGHTHDVQRREDMLSQIVGWVLSLPGHVLVAGDLNSSLQDSLALHQLVRQGYRTANPQEVVTCCAHNSHTGSVIDHVLFSPSLLQSFVCGEVLSAAPFPTHRPVCADFDFNPAHDSWSVLQPPRSFPLSECVSRSVKSQDWSADFIHVSNLLEDERPDDAYALWTQLAECELARQCRLGGKTVCSSHFGRAVVPALRVCDPQSLRLQGDVDFRRLERARAGLAELCSCWDSCVANNHSQAIWTNARRRILLVFRSHPLPSQLPGKVEVQTQLDWLRRTIDRRNKQRRDEVLSAWRTRMQMSQAERFKWAKAKYTSWQNIHDTVACFRKVEEIWQPILARRPDAAPSCPSNFTENGFAEPALSSSLKSTLHQLDMLRMSGSDLRSAVDKIAAHSACGADGWRRCELLALPACFWDLLAQVLYGMAASGTWHPCLRTVVTTLIPKKASVDFLTDPAGLRPISVASVVYRAWSGVVAQRLHAVLECSLPSCSHGFRTGESAQAAMASTYLRCQNASLSGCHVYLVSYDMHKCFDSLPWRKVRDSLVECGVQPACASALHSLWSGLRRIWKLQGRFSDASFSSTNGLFQGDPSAPACLSAFLCCPIRELARRFPEVSISLYADDVLLSSPHLSQLHAAHDFFVSWLQDQHVTLNIGKCKWASTCPGNDAVSAAHFQIGGVNLGRLTILEILGGHFDLGALCVGSSAHWTALLDKFLTIAKRFKCLSVGYEPRSRDIGALMNMLTYSAIAWDPLSAVDARTQRILVNVLSGGRTNTRRCLEVSLALLSPIHRSSIPHALLHEQVALLFRLANTNLEYQQLLQSHFHLCSEMTCPPADSFYVRLQQALQAFGWRWVAWNQLASQSGQMFHLVCKTMECRRRVMCQSFAQASDMADVMKTFASTRLLHKRELHQHSLSCLHALRDAMRHVCFQTASRRRRDMRNLEHVDRALLRRVLGSDEVACSIRCIMQGATLTADRLNRSSRGTVSATCPFCRLGVETEIHRWWQCPRWDYVRSSCLGEHAPVICAQLAASDSVASICGIPTLGLSAFLQSKWVDMCACMAAVLGAANEHDQ